MLLEVTMPGTVPGGTGCATGQALPVEDKMNIDERRKYLRIMWLRYMWSSRAERSQLLDEMEEVTELHRKSLIRLMHGDLTRQPRRKERGRTYGARVDDALRVIAESCDYVCAERLTPNLVWLAQHLARHGELTTSDVLLEQLGAISVSTVRRTLGRIRRDARRLPRKGPERANQVTRHVPMKRIPWDVRAPGHFETDLVHHCGVRTSGHYLHTLQMVKKYKLFDMQDFPLFQLTCEILSEPKNIPQRIENYLTKLYTK